MPRKHLRESKLNLYSYATFLGILPVCEVCRLEALNSDKTKTTALQVFKLSSTSFQRLIWLEQKRILARLLVKTPSRLKLCGERKPEHKIFLKTLRTKALAVQKIKEENLAKAQAKAQNQVKKNFDLLTELKALNSESLPDHIKQKFLARIKELEAASQGSQGSQRSQGSQAREVNSDEIPK